MADGGGMPAIPPPNLGDESLLPGAKYSLNGSMAGSRRSVSAPRSRPGSQSVPGPPGGQLQRTGANAGKKANYVHTKLHVYPAPMTPPKGTPMTESQRGRHERAGKKLQDLMQQFERAPEEEVLRGHGDNSDFPPWWSETTHGKPGDELMPSELDSWGRLTRPMSAGPLNVRSSMEAMRDSLGNLPWPDGRPVLDFRQRVRGECLTLEDEMRQHVYRQCDKLNKIAKSPSYHPRYYLGFYFKKRDYLKTGNVSVAEFVELWNDPCEPQTPGDPPPDPPGVDLHERVREQNPDTGTMDIVVKGGKPVLRKRWVTEAHAAALFCKYGYDKDGLMPYDVFINTLFTTPARLLGMQQIMRQNIRERHGFGDGDDLDFKGKIVYAKANKGVFAPIDFDKEAATRSSKAPTASMELEFAYGYAGLKNLSTNLFYTKSGEITYYVAGVGVVYNREAHTQRFFFGHNDDILSMCQHPERNWVATGQCKPVGPEEVPFVCIWDTRDPQKLDPKAAPGRCMQVQRINHPIDTRGIIAMQFTPSGSQLITVGSDNGHSLFIWEWRKEAKPSWQPESWSYGPHKRLKDLSNSPSGFFWQQDNPPCPPSKSRGYVEGAAPNAQHHGLVALSGVDNDGDVCPFGSATPSGEKVKEKPPEPGEPPKYVDKLPPPSNKVPGAWKSGDGSYELQGGEAMSAKNGAPPQVYGVVCNPWASGREFVTYGIKHLIFWHLLRNEEAGTVDMVDPDSGEKCMGKWEQTAGSFGPTQVENVLSAVFIKDSMGASFQGMEFREQIKNPETGKIFNKGHGMVTHTGKVIKLVRDPESDAVVKEKYIGDMPGGEAWRDRVTRAVLITGFPTGNVGVWINTKLMRVVKAHDTGPQVPLPDGTLTFGGVRCLRLRADQKTLLSAGADGCIHTWDVRQTVDDEEWMVKTSGGEFGAEREVENPNKGKKKILKERQGNTGIVLGRGAIRLSLRPEKTYKLTSPYKSETPPQFRALDCRPGSDVFIAGTNRCDIWEVDGDPEVLIYGHTADLYTVAPHPTDPDVMASACESDRVFLWNSKEKDMTRTARPGFKARSVAFSQCGQHLAVGGKQGRVVIMAGDTLQPLEKFKPCVTSIDEMKYSPNNRFLATGSHDLVIDIYDTGFRDKGGKVRRFPEVNRCWAYEGGEEGHEQEAGLPKWGGYQHLSRLAGHAATIMHLDWSLPLFNPPELRGKTVIQTNCNGREILYWDPVARKQLTINQRNAKWHTWTCKLGFPVMGIWGDGQGNMDLNSLCRSNSQEYCVTSDDNSNIKLFNFPCVFDDAPFRQYKGHSSHIMNIRFSADDRHVYTVGGADRAMLQFKTHGINKDDLQHALPPDQRVVNPNCDVDCCKFCGREPEPRPRPPEWGPLDAKGKTWGEVQLDADGVCQCSAPDIHKCNGAQAA